MRYAVYALSVLLSPIALAGCQSGGAPANHPLHAGRRLHTGKLFERADNSTTLAGHHHIQRKLRG